ncbi:hypothetical protein HDU97_004385 [Phlyctochytrium planicorne]|nr:hypothetical protein HDU97_004385 [Phlyctochytrium planicorne]
MNSSNKTNGPARTLSFNPKTKRILINNPTLEQRSWSHRQLLEHTFSVMRSAFNTSHGHPDRLIYGFLSKAFVVSAPRPIGGKRKPGFLQFEGDTATDALRWTLEKALLPPEEQAQRRRPPPGSVLEFLVQSANEMLEQQDTGTKDELDNTVLKGMRRCGHLNDEGRIVLPVYLRLNETTIRHSQANRDDAASSGEDRVLIKTDVEDEGVGASSGTFQDSTYSKLKGSGGGGQSSKKKRKEAGSPSRQNMGGYSKWPPNYMPGYPPQPFSHPGSWPASQPSSQFYPPPDQTYYQTPQMYPPQANQLYGSASGPNSNFYGFPPSFDPNQPFGGAQQAPAGSPGLAARPAGVPAGGQTANQQHQMGQSDVRVDPPKGPGDTQHMASPLGANTTQ